MVYLVVGLTKVKVDSIIDQAQLFSFEYCVLVTQQLGNGRCPTSGAMLAIVPQSFVVKMFNYILSHYLLKEFPQVVCKGDRAIVGGQRLVPTLKNPNY